MSGRETLRWSMPGGKFKGTIPLELRTSRPEIAVQANFTPSTDNPPVCLLLIHGNSSCSRIFEPLLAALPPSFPLPILTLDLPGHGESSDHPDPAAYTQPGYARDIADALAHPALRVRDVVVFGWSLGGHIGIELIPLLGARLRGLLIVGTPPVLGTVQAARGFRMGEHMRAAGKDELTDAEVRAYGEQTCGPPRREWVVESVRRTDGRARKAMFDAFGAGRGIDQRKAVAEWKGLIGVVNGAEEPFVNLDYLEECTWGHLWEGKCHRIEKLGHAPFWEDPEGFTPYLTRFVDGCLKQS